MNRFLALIYLLFSSSALVSSADAKTVLFDQAHAQAFTVEKEGPLQLGTLATILKNAGLTVQTTETPLSNVTLHEIDVLIISGAFRPHTQQEIDAVKEFLSHGGRVAIMLHIAQTFWPLLDDLGVDVANGVLREQTDLLENEPINFKVTNFSQHTLTKDLKSFNLYGGWPLRPAAKHVRTIAQSSDKAWVDMNGDTILNTGDVVQQFGIIVSGTIGQGEFVVFADDAIFQNRFLTEGNRELAENLGRWLSGI